MCLHLEMRCLKWKPLAGSCHYSERQARGVEEGALLHLNRPSRLEVRDPIVTLLSRIRIEAMSSKGTVIVFGLDGVNRIEGHPAHATPEWILSGVKKSTEDANSAGWDAEYFLFDHEDKQLIDKVSTKLKEKKWDVVCIGAGVRLTPQLTWLFEDVTNAVVTLVSPPPKFVFQVSPDGLLERLQYLFPDKS